MSRKSPKFLILCFGLLLLGCNRSSQSTSGDGERKSPPPAKDLANDPKPVPPGPAKDHRAKTDVRKPAWTLDLAQMKIPDAKASGKIRDVDFVLDKAELENGVLTLRQGKDFFPDAAVKVWLFLKDEETVEGKSFRITPNKGFGGPHLELNWKPKGQKGQPFPKSETFFSDKYAMILEFGKAKGNVIPGTIYLCVADELKSCVAGTFTLGAEPAGGGEISGKLTVRGDAKGLWIEVGCLGKNPKGQLEAPGVGFELGKGNMSATCSTWAPRNTKLAWDQKTGSGTHKHTNRPAGRYLVYLRGRAGPQKDGPINYEGYHDWKWVELKDDKSKVTVDLTIDPSNQGNLEVQVTGSPKDAVVTYLPLDADGRLPLPEAHRYFSASSSAKLEGGKAIIRGLREGKYQVACGGATADVEVKRATTVTVKMSAK
jgi:hypothetical protein